MVGVFVRIKCMANSHLCIIAIHIHVRYIDIGVCKKLHSLLVIYNT